jgi:predicted AlkP superfamily pyrophosphatase or phosphodiesterase
MASWPRFVLTIFVLLSGCGGSSIATLPDEPAALQEQELAPTDAPKGPLVLAVVIDQLGSETLTKLEPLLDAQGAFARARTEGRVYRRVIYSYGATLTAPGHAAIFSGAPPSQSGVTANARVDRKDFNRYDFVDDRRHAILGAPGRFASPALMRVDTVADALKAQTGGQAKVVALSGKDRGVVFVSRQRPDLALWYEPSALGFTTSTFYASELPSWLVEHNRAHPPNLEAQWNVANEARLLALLGPDAAPGEGPPEGLGNVFPHRLATSKRPADDWTLLPDSTEALLELALVARAEAGLCADEIPDLMAISISATDLVGHRFGPFSWEYAESLRHADLVLARFVEQLERDCAVSVLITSDHGVAPLPEQSGTKRVDGLQEKVEAQLDVLLGDGDWTVRYDPPYLYLGPRGRAFGDRARLGTALTVALSKIPGVVEGIDVRDSSALEARGDVLASQVLASIDLETSGEIYVVLERGAVPSFGAAGVGTTHGSPYSYDTDVPVLVWGAGITPSIQLEPYDQARVASTLAALLAIDPPLAGAPKPLPGVTAAKH